MLAGATEEELASVAETRYVFTSGLFVHELVAGDLETEDGVRALGERVGFEWLGSYADAEFRDLGPEPGSSASPLTEWTQSIRIAAPGEPSSQLVHGEPLHPRCRRTYCERSPLTARS